MSEVIPLNGAPRLRLGKGGSRQTRRDGRVPAIIYGGEGDPLPISLDPVEIDKQANRHGFHSHVFEIDVDGGKYRVLAREIQRDLISGKPSHVDFMRVTERSRVHVAVDLSIRNEAAAPGVVKGGVINLVMHSLDIVASADAIPEELVIDLTGIDIATSVHVRDVILPDGCSLGNVDPEATVLTIVPPGGGAKEAAAETEAAG